MLTVELRSRVRFLKLQLSRFLCRRDQLSPKWGEAWKPHVLKPQDGDVASNQLSKHERETLQYHNKKPCPVGIVKRYPSAKGFFCRWAGRGKGVLPLIVGCWCTLFQNKKNGIR